MKTKTEAEIRILDPNPAGLWRGTVCSLVLARLIGRDTAGGPSPAGPAEPGKSAPGDSNFS